MKNTVISFRLVMGTVLNVNDINVQVGCPKAVTYSGEEAENVSTNS